MSILNSKRAKVLGDLIQKARLFAHRSVADCAEALIVTPDVYEKMETGDTPVSLPDLEALAVYLQVPMGYFWGTDQLPDSKETDYKNFVSLRHKLIAVNLRRLRLQQKKSADDLAQLLDMDTAQIEAYESGETSIPFLYLELLSKELEVSLNFFVDDERGPLGRHEQIQQLLRQFNGMSPEMRAFISNPRNVSYMETAKTLSEMDVQRLRLLAESILDITF